MKYTDKSEMGEFWADVREHDAQQRKSKREANTELAKTLAEKYGLTITEYNDGTQLRLISEKKAFDYFPTSGKVKIGNRFFFANLENEIKKHFAL